MNYVRRIIDSLRAQYAKDGTPYQLNEVQATNYLRELGRFPEPALESAAAQWQRQSRFFPALSDLLGILEPRVDEKTQAALAWSELEATARRFSNSYRSVKFDDPVLGECVRRVFGSWSRLVLMDQNDPMWASRKNLFLQIYPAMVANPPHGQAVILAGHDGGRDIQGTVTCTRPGALPEPDRSRQVLREVTRRFKELGGPNREAS